MTERIALTGVTLIDGRGGDPVERAVVVVEEGRIVAAARGTEVPRLPDARVIDAEGATVMPGIVDAHCRTGLTPYGEQTLREVRALVEAGLTEMEALVAATRAGAEILRIEDETGTLEPGKAADLIVLRRDPLQDMGALDAEEMLLVLKEGRAVRDVLSSTG
jgi:imidazolonepropionase-like amidohydrolase